MTDTVDKIVIQSETQGVQQSTNDVQGLTKAMDGVTVASQNVEKSTGSIDSKFAALERRFSTTAGQATQLARVQKSVNDAVAANPALQDRANEVLAAATARYGTAVAAEKALTDAHVGLSAQGQAALHSVRSVVEQLALGIPPTQALTGQMNHLSFAATGQGGLSGAFSEVAGKFTSFLTPMRLVVGGVAGVAAAALYLGNSWAESSAQVDRSLIGIGAATGSTAADLSSFAKANSTAFGLTIGEAKNAAIEFTKTGDIAVKGLKGVGDAIHGYAVLTGKDATDATKDLAASLSGDLVKGAENLNKTYMAFDASALEYIQTLQTSGERAKAVQFIVDSIAPANQKAADSVGILTKAYQALAGAMSAIKNGPPAIVSGTPQDRLQQAQTSRDAAGTSLSGQLSGGFGSDILGGADAVPILKNLDDAIKTAQKDAAEFGGIGQEAFVKLSTEAKSATEAIFPQIEQIRKLEVELSKLQEAKEKGAADPNVNASITAYQNVIAGLKEQVATADVYNTRVKQISASWGDVDQATAMALQAAQNQLPVLEAVGGGAKMAAQYTADYKNYMDQGKTSTEAAALAASNLAAAQAQASSAGKETLAALQDQYGVAAASNPLQAAHAQGIATTNSLLRQGVDTQTAMNAGAQQEENIREQIYQQMEKAVRKSRDAVDLQATNGTLEQANVKHRIAYNDAIDAGATSTQAAIIANNAGTVAAMQWADQAQRLAQAYEDAARAAANGAFNSTAFGAYKDTAKGSGIVYNTGANTNSVMPIVTIDGTQVTWNNPLPISEFAQLNNLKEISPNNYSSFQAPVAADAINAALAAGGVNNAIAAAQSVNGDINTIDQLYQLKVGQTSDKNAQASILQDELTYLKSRPETLDRDNKIAQLTDSINNLIKSTDSLNSTNQDLLSPYYSQDPRTSHIGFRSQGMATGGWVDVPGSPSANDNMIATIPVAGGERIYVDPNPSKRGMSSQGGGGGVVINLGGLTVNTGGAPADSNAIGRTVYQMVQSAGRQLQAASR
ncbi:hypothetical protein ABIF26_006458 [Bradyrhizobium elkanii]|uniref:phage tail length tape measure family protein n=1 Tax=Bradyrhizobium elkanii TaxID=29448 RepID=UPI003514A2F1